MIRPSLVAALFLASNVAFAGGATTVFSYPDGFAGVTSEFTPVADASEFNGGIMEPADGVPGMHEAGAVWYNTQVDVSSFMTSFTFRLGDTGIIPSIVGMTFCIQNSTLATNPDTQYGNRFGTMAGADANMDGYGAYMGQYPIGNSVAVKFDVNPAGQVTYPPTGGSPSGSGLYINGGPFAAFFPEIDLNPAKINLNVGHTMAATLVYDGSLLTMTLLDTQTNAQLRTSWPIDIPTAVGQKTAWVGFTAGEIPAEVDEVLSWSFASGMNTRLATPTFSVAEGAYDKAQTVSITGPSGATIYYSTDGMDPTTSSQKYTAPIAVSASTVVKAVAIEGGFTDSLVGTANYRIAPSGTPYINFPSGFANAAGLVTQVGSTVLNGTALRLTDTNTNGNEVGAAWYVTPVDVTQFETHFRLQFGSANGEGMTFVIQNQNPTSTDTTTKWVSGGPYALGDCTGLGYSGNTGTLGEQTGISTSIAVVFDFRGGADATGLYTNGADVTGAAVDMTSSGVKLTSGNPLDVTLDYDGTSLAMTVTDSVTHATFTHSFAIDIPKTVMGNTAYVGFTGSTFYNLDADQDILSWTFEPTGVSYVSSDAGSGDDGAASEDDGGIADNLGDGSAVTPDGGTTTTGNNSSGCSCDVAGAGTNSPPVFVISALLLAWLIRSARWRRGPSSR